MASKRHLDLIERTNKTLQEVEGAAIERIEAALETAYRRLEKQILAQYPGYTATAKPGLLANQRALLLMDEIKELLPLFNPKLREQIQKEFRQLLKTASSEGITLSSELMRLSAGDEFVKSTATVPIEAVAIAAEQAYKRLEKYGADFAGKSTALITQGLVQGWGAQRIVPGLRQQLGIAKGKAEMIARTETMAAHNQAAQQNYRDNGLSHFQWLATGDDRLCSLCGARNGNVYELGKVPIPGHPNCRCYAMPYSLTWKSLGLTNDKWMENFSAQGLKELEAAGKTPDSGLMPFEKAMGMEKPPEPVWTSERMQDSRTERQPSSANEGSVKPITAKEPTLSKLAKPYIFNGFKYSEQFLKPIRESGFDTETSLAAMKNLKSQLLKDGLPKKEALKLLQKARIEVDDVDVETALIEFYQITRGKGSKSLSRVFKDPAHDRAYADKSGRLNMGDAATPSRKKQIVFHEMGHHFEFESEALTKASADWIRSRATATEPVPLNQLTPGGRYRDSEVALPDKFISPYIGKIYANGSTEVLSMGLEAFTSEAAMLRLYTKDPAHFSYVLGAILS